LAERKQGVETLSITTCTDHFNGPGRALGTVCVCVCVSGQ